MALFPKEFLALMQRLAVDNPDAFAERGWVAPYVRLEGLVVTVVCLAGGRVYEVFMKYIGVAGAFMLLAPRQYVEFGNRLAYSGSDPFEWRRRYLPGVRACGAFLVLLAIRALRRSDGTE